MMQTQPRFSLTSTGSRPAAFSDEERFFPLVLCNFPGCVRKMGNLIQVIPYRRQLLYELDVGGIRARANLVTDKQLPNDRLHF